MDNFSKDCENVIEENYAEMDSKLNRQGTVTLSPEIMKQRHKTKRLLRCKQATINCFRHLNRIRQSLQFMSHGYIPRCVRRGIEDVNKILLQLQQIDVISNDGSPKNHF